MADTASTAEDAAIAIDVLANDTDPDDTDSLSIADASGVLYMDGYEGTSTFDDIENFTW